MNLLWFILPESSPCEGKPQHKWISDFIIQRGAFASPNNQLTHWTGSDLPSLTRAGSGPIIEAAVLRRKAGHETLPIGGLVWIRIRFGNAGTAQSGQSSGPGDPCGSRTQSEAGAIFRGIAQERDKGRGGEDQPGGNCGSTASAGAVHGFVAEARRAGRQTLFLEYSGIAFGRRPEH